MIRYRAELGKYSVAWTFAFLAFSEPVSIIFIYCDSCLKLIEFLFVAEELLGGPKIFFPTPLAPSYFAAADWLEVR